MRDYYEQLYDNKLDNLEEIYKFIEIYKLLRLNHELIENLNSSKLVRRPSQLSKTSKKEKPSIRWIHWKILPTFKKELKPTLLKLFEKLRKSF